MSEDESYYEMQLLCDEIAIVIAKRFSRPNAINIILTSLAAATASLLMLGDNPQSDKMRFYEAVDGELKKERK